MRCESRSASRRHSQALHLYILPLVVLAALPAARLVAGVSAGKQLTSSTENKRAEEFSRLPAQLSPNKQGGGEVDEEQPGRARGSPWGGVPEGLKCRRRSDGYCAA